MLFLTFLLWPSLVFLALVDLYWEVTNISSYVLEQMPEERLRSVLNAIARILRERSYKTIVSLTLIENRGKYDSDRCL